LTNFTGKNHRNGGNLIVVPDHGARDKGGVVWKVGYWHRLLAGG
jgi:hypothetical protein